MGARCCRKCKIFKPHGDWDTHYLCPYCRTCGETRKCPLCEKFSAAQWALIAVWLDNRPTRQSERLSRKGKATPGKRSKRARSSSSTRPDVGAIPRDSSEIIPARTRAEGPSVADRSAPSSSPVKAVLAADRIRSAGSQQVQAGPLEVMAEVASKMAEGQAESREVLEAASGTSAGRTESLGSAGLSGVGRGTDPTQQPGRTDGFPADPARAVLGRLHIRGFSSRGSGRRGHGPHRHGPARPDGVPGHLQSAAETPQKVRKAGTEAEAPQVRPPKT